MALKVGIVYLIGAGPGDPGLITVKGLRALERADVVVYDHLVSERLLDSCRAAAARVYAGKETGRKTLTQAAINRLLVRHARAGRVVARLKGGDPLLFGRGGEEALALTRARVPYEIIPGVTSAVAVPAYAGIPVTHRDYASSLAVITGHEDPDKSDSALRWERLATATDTLVCLMGVSTLPSIVEQLRRHGRPAGTPCAVIEWGTWTRQRTVVGTLGTIVARCRQARVAPPAVTVVGDVVRLRRRLNWFETKPLFGRRIVVTRPAGRADALAAMLETLGAEVATMPAIELVPAGAPARLRRSPGRANGLFHRALERMEGFDWVFFTSPEGIHWFRRLLIPHHRDLRILRGRRIGAIGPKTAAAIEQLGIHVDFTPRTYSQEGMVSGLGTRRLAGKRALILSAEEGRDLLARGLRTQGMEVVRVPIYRTAVPAQLAERVGIVFRRPADYVTVTSSSCVNHLAQAIRAGRLKAAIRTIRFASIGPVTSAAVRAAGGTVAVEARTATIEGLVEAIVASSHHLSRRQRRRVGWIADGCRAAAR